MALTITQAIAVNAICNYLCRPAMREVDEATVRGALGLLAEDAHKRLQAGFDGNLVLERWHGKTEETGR